MQILRVLSFVRHWVHLGYARQEPQRIILKEMGWWRGLIEPSFKCSDPTPVSEVIGSSICLWFCSPTAQPLTLLLDSPLSNSCLDTQPCVRTCRKHQLLNQCPIKLNYAGDLQSFVTWWTPIMLKWRTARSLSMIGMRSPGSSVWVTSYGCHALEQGSLMLGGRGDGNQESDRIEQL